MQQDNSELAGFWWGDTDEKKRKHWWSWKSMCSPKSEKGIGFRDLASFNKALLARQCWRIIRNPHVMWVRILKARYFPNSTFLKAKKGARASGKRRESRGVER